MPEYSLEDFDYSYPEDQVAQYPLSGREDSRLFVNSKEVLPFSDITSLLSADDILVINSSRVFKARVEAFHQQKNKNLELLFVKEKINGVWDAMVKGARHIKINDVLELKGGLKVQVAAKDQYLCSFKTMEEINLFSYLNKYGEVPLPPYIKRKSDQAFNDSERYQTVYADRFGSSAAPTAGLHFTEDILNSLTANGVEILSVNLNVGPGTFLPVREDNIYNHKMHSEFIELSPAVAERLNKARSQGKKITAVGTTTLRVLESCYDSEKEEFFSFHGETDIFICPPAKVRSVDNLITNFHQPKSTLFMLVAALTGLQEIKKIYQTAIRKGLRLFSYGDAVFLHNKYKNVK